jgi:hypothetical protein
MKPATRLGIALAAVFAFSPAALAGDRNVRIVPALPKAPALAGNLKKDFAKADVLKTFGQGGTSITAKVGYFKTSLYLGVTIVDDHVTPGDILDVMLHFPEAGTTAAGHFFRFAPDGRRTADGEDAAPAFAQALVKAAVAKQSGGVAFEIQIPARALPRFPAWDPMTLDLCLTYEDLDVVGEEPEKVSNCTGASMGSEALKVPDDFRKRLGLDPTEEVVGIESRENGWVGYGILHYPAWVFADKPLTFEALRGLTADQPVDPSAAGVNVPQEIPFRDRSALYAIVSGKDPYAESGKCDNDAELRMALYLFKKGRAAPRVLEWPAANCALGRITSVVLDEDGGLTISYSNGSQVTFAWSGDKFERSQIG